MVNEIELNIRNLRDVIKQLNNIQIDNSLCIFHQDDILKKYIRSILEMCSTIDFDKLDLQKEYYIIRSIMFYLHRLTDRLPARPDEGLLFYFFNRNSKGTIYSRVCKLYNKIFDSEFYRNATNINTILAEANESGCLDLSYLAIRSSDFGKILMFKQIKHLSIVELIIDGKSVSEHLKLKNFKYFNTIVTYLSLLTHLQSLKLSGFCLNDKILATEQLQQFINVLSNLEMLAYLDLSDNYINDSTLECMFKLTNKNNILSGNDKFFRLKVLILSYNLLRFDKYYKYEFENTKLFFDVLLARQIMLDLTCNNIHYFDIKHSKHVETDIFKIYKNIMFKSNIYCESILNPHYLIDMDHCLIAIADDLKHEHAEIFATFIDSNSQRCLMQYHLIEDDDPSKQGYTKVLMDQFKYKESHDLFGFVEEKSKTLVFGNFYVRNKTIFNKMEQAIAEQFQQNGLKEYLYRLHFSFNQKSLNCYRFCLNFISQYVDHNLNQPVLAIARFDLSNTIPTQLGTFCFAMLNDLIFFEPSNMNLIKDRKQLFTLDQ